jgi:MFS family permease
MSDDNVGKPYPPAAYAWIVVCILLSAFIVSMIDRQILSLMVQPIKLTFGISDVQFSLLHGFAFVIFYTTFGLAFGWIADRYNRRNLIIIGMIMWCVATTACGLAATFGQFFVARIFVGVGEAALAPAAYSIIADYFPLHRRARPSTVYAMGTFMGAGLAMVLGGAIMGAVSATAGVALPVFGALSNWRAVFVLVGLPGLLVAALMFLVREPVRREKADQRANLHATFAFLWTNATALGLLYGAFSFTAMVNFVLLAWLPTFFVRDFGWTSAGIGSTYGTISLVFGCVGVVAGGAVADRMVTARGKGGVIQTVVWSGALLIPATAVVGLANNATVSLIALAAATFVGVIPIGLTSVALFQIAPNQYRGQVIAISNLCVSLIGMGVGPVLVAALTDHVFHDEQSVGYSISIVTTLAAIMSLICFVLARRRVSKVYIGARAAVPTP